MAYKIVVTVSPVPTDNEQAWKWIDVLAKTVDKNPPQIFHELIDQLLARYPCYSELLAQGRQKEAVWSDGPLRNNIELLAPVIGMWERRVDEAVPFLIETANSFGLTVFDPNTEIIHRPELNDVHQYQ